MPRSGARRRSDASAGTRQRLVEAATAVLARDGYAGATARAVGAEAGCNPALVFYHYGTLNGLLLAALDASSEASLQRYRAGLDRAGGLREVLAVAREQHRVDRDSGHINLVAQMVAGGVLDRALGREVAARIEPWVALTRGAVAQSVPSAVGRRLPVDDLAFAIVAMALGAQLLAALSGDYRRTEAAVERLTAHGGLLRSLLGGSEVN